MRFPILQQRIQARRKAEQESDEIATLLWIAGLLLAAYIGVIWLLVNSRGAV